MKIPVTWLYEHIWVPKVLEGCSYKSRYMLIVATFIRRREILTEQNSKGHNTHCHYRPLKQHELLGVTQIQAFLDEGICYCQAVPPFSWKLSPEAAVAEPCMKEFLNCQSLLRVYEHLHQLNLAQQLETGNYGSTQAATHGSSQLLM